MFTAGGVPAAMEELAALGLVKQGARYPVMRSCWVPTEHVEAMREVFYREPDASSGQRVGLQCQLKDAGLDAFIRHNVLIWSDEHHAYWRPGGNGYTAIRAKAWVLPFEDAYLRTRHCGPEKRIEFEVA